MQQLDVEAGFSFDGQPCWGDDVMILYAENDRVITAHNRPINNALPPSRSTALRGFEGEAVYC